MHRFLILVICKNIAGFIKQHIRSGLYKGRVKTEKSAVECCSVHGTEWSDTHRTGKLWRDGRKMSGQNLLSDILAFWLQIWSWILGTSDDEYDDNDIDTHYQNKLTKAVTFWFVFGWFSIRTSPGTRTIPTEAFCDFSQFPQANSGIVPEMKPRTLPSTTFPIIH
jgi:hypothetical protein